MYVPARICETLSGRVDSLERFEQAACLAAYRWEQGREALAEALTDLLSRDKGWVSRYRQGAAALRSAYLELEVSARLAIAV